MIFNVATHSNTELRAITKKFLLSGLENLPEPSAMLSGILKEALVNWSFAVLSNLLLLINFFESI